MSTVDSSSILAVGVLFPLLGAVAVGFRFWRRSRRGVKWDTDDWLCVPALMLVVACGVVLVIGASQKVVGSDAYVTPDKSGDVDPKSRVLLEKLGLAFDVLQILALAALEISVIFLYRRFFPSKRFVVCCNLMGGVVIQWVLTFVASVLIFCIRRLQDSSASISKFASANSFVDVLLVVLSVESILINIALFVLPIPALTKLHPPPRTLLGAAGVFAVAAAAISCGIVKLALPATATNSPPEGSTLDLLTGILSGDNPPAVGVYMLWGMIELASLLVAICLPAMGSFLETSRVRIPSRAGTPFDKARGLGVQMDYDDDDGNEERGRSESALGLRNESLTNDLDPNYKFLESHVSMQFLSSGKKRGVSPAPEGAIMVENQITQTVETV